MAESVTQLKQQLEALGYPTTTPGLVGEVRFLELKYRLDTHANITKRSSDNNGGSSSSADAKNGGDASRARQKLESLKQASLANCRNDESGEGDDMFRFDINENDDLNEMDDDEDDENEMENEGDDTTADEAPAPAPSRTNNTTNMIGTAAATATAAVVPPPVGMLVPPKKVPPPPMGAPPVRSPVKRDRSADNLSAPLSAHPEHKADMQSTNTAMPGDLKTVDSTSITSGKPHKPVTSRKHDDDDDNLSAGEPAADDDDIEGELDADQAQIKELRTRGKLLESRGDLGGAEGAYQEALRVDPLNVKTLTVFAVFLHRRRGEMVRCLCVLFPSLTGCIWLHPFAHANALPLS